MKYLLLILLLVVGCSPTGQQDVYGCTDETACNFNVNATIDDNACFYAEDWEDECGVCDLIPSNNCVEDECGIWGGTGEDADDDGICDDVDECIGAEYDECGVCGGDSSSCVGCYTTTNPCHGSMFNQDGVLLNGPAETNLTEYLAVLSNDSAVISDDEGEVGIILLSNHVSLQEMGGVSHIDSIDFNSAGLLLYRKTEEDILVFSREGPHCGCQLQPFELEPCNNN